MQRQILVNHLIKVKEMWNGGNKTEASLAFSNDPSCLGTLDGGPSYECIDCILGLDLCNEINHFGEETNWGEKELKAETKSQFVEIWNEEVNRISILYNSLPKEKLPELRVILKQLRGLVDAAADFSYYEVIGEKKNDVNTTILGFAMEDVAEGAVLIAVSGELKVKAKSDCGAVVVNSQGDVEI